MQYIIGSWYRKDELAKRSCIFHTSSGIASMFSGYLMDAVYRLGGRNGFKGWQWYAAKSTYIHWYWCLTRLFVIDGVISLPVALSGFFVLPDVPEISNPWYLTKDVWLCSFTRFRHRTVMSGWFSTLLGGCTGAKANANGGSTKSGTIYKVQVKEDFLFVAYLSVNAAVYSFQ